MRLFGRDQEKASLEAFLAERSGEHRLMLLRGDPGSGKSALLEFAAARAPGLVLKVGGMEALGHVELAASMGMLNRLAVEREEENLLSRILDEDPGARVVPIHLFEATRRLLEGQCGSLLIDDVQWLDDLSLGLILYLLKNAREPSHLVAASRPPNHDRGEARPGSDG